jgi:hypothetical protein
MKTSLICRVTCCVVVLTVCAERSICAAELIELSAFRDFSVLQTGDYVPAYKEAGNQALAIDASQHKDKFAAGKTVFEKPSGTYDVIITTLTETDGESTYQLLINGKKAGEFQNPATEKDYVPAQHRWPGIEMKNGDEVIVAFNTHSNKRTPEGAGFAFARGRWRSLAFVSPGAAIAAAPSVSPSAAEPPFPDKDASAYFKFDFDPAKAARVFEEKDGLLVVEAEHFAVQTNDSVRKWYLTTKTETPSAVSDGDGNHAETASGGAYLEILPDTRRNHDEAIIGNENFTEDAGRMAVLYYPVYINTPGRYYLWARVCSTGSEDNGLHAGLDGKWLGTMIRMQWIGKNGAWLWDSKQRTEKVTYGVRYRIYFDVKEPGFHTVMFSMREDGFEMDKWLGSTNKDVLKHGDPGMGFAESSMRK